MKDIGNMIKRNDDDDDNQQQPIAVLPDGYALYDPILRGTCDFCHRKNVIVNREDIITTEKGQKEYHLLCLSCEFRKPGTTGTCTFCHKTEVQVYRQDYTEFYYQDKSKNNNYNFWF